VSENIEQVDQTNQQNEEPAPSLPADLPTKQDLNELVEDLDQIDVALANFNQVDPEQATSI